MGPPQTAGAGDLTGGVTGDAQHLAGSATIHLPSEGTYSPRPERQRRLGAGGVPGSPGQPG